MGKSICESCIHNNEGWCDVIQLKETISDGCEYYSSLVKIRKELEDNIESKDLEADLSAKLCEIAYICGVLKQEGRINFVGDLYDMYNIAYKPILEEWKNGLNKGVFLSKEEEGYISAYAQRRLLELYG